MQKKNIFLLYLAIFLFYLLFSVILCRGQIFDLNNMIFGDYGDTRGFLFSDWRVNNPQILGPLESPINNTNFIPLLSYLGRFLTYIFGYVGGHNFGIFISFPLVSFVAFLFFQYITNNKFISFPFGLIFGFTPFAVMHAFNGHPYLSFNLLIPFLFLFLYFRIFNKNKTLKNTFLISLILTLMVFSNPYYAFFSSLIIFFFFTYELVYLKKFKKIFYDYLLIFFIPLILFIVINYSFIFDYFNLNENISNNSFLNRSFSDTFLYSTRPWQFFIPSIDSYFFGDFFEYSSRKLLFGSNLVEQTYYLGLILILLIFCTIYFNYKNIFNKNEKKIITCFFYLASFIFFMTLPPLVLFNNFQVPTLNYLVYDFFPMFRVLSRFNIFLIFIILIICSFSLKYIYSKYKKFSILIFLLITFITIIEFLFISNNKVTEIPKIPNAYNHIEKNQDTLIAEYPFVKNNEFHHYDYIMWQYFHRIKILNGFNLNSDSNINYFNNIQDLSSDITYSKLLELGVTHIVVHKNKFKEGIIPSPIKKYFSINLSERLFDLNVPLIINERFLLIYQDDDIQIFKL